MATQKWGANNIPDQSGKVVIVTGASSGLGEETARALAGKNARVIMAVRNTGKGEAVAAAIRKQQPSSDIAVRELDLASLASVTRFAEGVRADIEHLDTLVNNAGIMMCPFARTADGFEIQMGTNHLGHFALVGHLLPLMKSTAGARLVVLSSVAHKGGDPDFSDLNWETRKYNTYRAYGDSKLANLLFAYELARRLEGEGNTPLVTAAHPGWTATELQRHTGVFEVLNRVFAQNVHQGTLPTLRAATDEEAKPGDYFGPGGVFEMRGHPVKVASTKRSHDVDAARRLWELSEQMTGVSYD